MNSDRFEIFQPITSLNILFYWIYRMRKIIYKTTGE